MHSFKENFCLFRIICKYWVYQFIRSVTLFYWFQIYSFLVVARFKTDYYISGIAYLKDDLVSVLVYFFICTLKSQNISGATILFTCNEDNYYMRRKSWGKSKPFCRFLLGRDFAVQTIYMKIMSLVFLFSEGGKFKIKKCHIINYLLTSLTWAALRNSGPQSVLPWPQANIPQCGHFLVNNRVRIISVMLITSEKKTYSACFVTYSNCVGHNLINRDDSNWYQLSRNNDG